LLAVVVLLLAVSAFLLVIPAFLLVIPAKAGIQLLLLPSLLPLLVIPAQAGIQSFRCLRRPNVTRLDSGLRRNDERKKRRKSKAG
jgi:hypothetical protein